MLRHSIVALTLLLPGAPALAAGEGLLLEVGRAETGILPSHRLIAVNGSVGLRLDLASTWGWVSLKSGYAYSLNDDPYEPYDASQLTQFTQAAEDVLTPGGATFAIAGGVLLDLL